MGRLDGGLEPAICLLDACDLGTELERDALLLQQALELLGDLVVHAGQDAVEEFHDRHLGAEPPPYRAELEADHAGADDEQLSGDLRQLERACGGDDALLVDLDALEPRHVGAGGDDDVLAFDRLGLAALARDLDLAAPEDLAGAAVGDVIVFFLKR